MVIDLQISVVVTWTPIRIYSTLQQGSQPSSLPGSPLYTSSERPAITCFTLYISENTLTTYTIAIVQNAQALQYDQMHVNG